MYRSKLWRRFSSFNPRDLHSIPILSQSHFLSPLSSSSSIPCDSAKPMFSVETPNFSEKLWRNFYSDSPSKIGVRRCWNCNSSPNSEPFLVCGSCRCVQPLDPSIDYFQIFGLERKYDIEDGSLEGKYKDWQKKLHPDLVHSKSESERQYAAEQSARVIDAYRTLNNSLSRAMYLVQSHICKHARREDEKGIVCNITFPSLCARNEMAFAVAIAIMVATLHNRSVAAFK